MVGDDDHDPDQGRTGRSFFQSKLILSNAETGVKFRSMTKRPYIKHGRLADVLALIQVLAFDPHTHRSEAHVIDKEIGTPCSAKGWVELAKEHPEMFRVSDEAKRPLSLIARHVQPVITRRESARQTLFGRFFGGDPGPNVGRTRQGLLMFESAASS
jgi:hypothetical protein